MKIGLVNYLNALPLYFGQTPPQDFTFTFASPTQLNAMLRGGELDVALTSSTEYLDGEYQLLPGFCIAAHREIMSVNLYLKGTLEEGTIGITPKSATASSLLKVLCRHVWRVSPNFVDLNEAKDGFLLIGDDALQHPTFPGYQTIDLAHAWYEATQLPFVFAVFSALPNVDCAPLHDFLEKAMTTPVEVIEEEAKRRSGLPHDRIHRYYEVCHYRLGSKELEGFEKFKEYREDLSLVVT